MYLKKIISSLSIIILCSLFICALPVTKKSVSDKFKVNEKLNINGFNCVSIEDLNEVVTKVVIVNNKLFNSVNEGDVICNDLIYKSEPEIELIEDVSFIIGKEYDIYNGYFVNLINYNENTLLNITEEDCESIEIGTCVTNNEIESLKMNFEEHTVKSKNFSYAFCLVVFIIVCIIASRR